MIAVDRGTIVEALPFTYSSSNRIWEDDDRIVATVTAPVRDHEAVLSGLELLAAWLHRAPATSPFVLPWAGYTGTCPLKSSTGWVRPLTVSPALEGAAVPTGSSKRGSGTSTWSGGRSAVESRRCRCRAPGRSVVESRRRRTSTFLAACLSVSGSRCIVSGETHARYKTDIA